ncbi:hypothetical protein MHU86_19659 [Fragilaria crotonensis]|nr:hypothetical protein MHU86_19659 [Fragilaria crotonensis]
MSHSLDSALIRYAKDGNVDKVRDLLHRGANGNAKALDEDGHDWTALMWASDKGHMEVVCVLLNHAEVDVNIKGAFGLTALAHASGNGNLEVVRALLNHNGVDVNIKDKYGRTALTHAIFSGHLEVESFSSRHQECQHLSGGRFHPPVD